jgi:hypothetical protein
VDLVQPGWSAQVMNLLWSAINLHERQTDHHKVIADSTNPKALSGANV